MTEEIIIDGVNVSNCEFIGNIKNGFVICTSWVHNNKKSENGHWDCRENKNCYYKQIKRLEQENKELGKQIESQKGLITVGGKQQYQYSQKIDELEQENKKLKEENKQHIKEKQILNERLYCYAYEKDCHLVCKQQNCSLKNSYTYRSALEEIREIAEKYKNMEGCRIPLGAIEMNINEVLQ